MKTHDMKVIDVIGKSEIDILIHIRYSLKFSY